MTDLSPAAQAVYDAFNRIGLYNEPSFETDRKALAAALISAADQVVPIEHEIIDNCWYEKANSIREQFLAIAAELEDAH